MNRGTRSVLVALVGLAAVAAVILVLLREDSLLPDGLDSRPAPESDRAVFDAPAAEAPSAPESVEPPLDEAVRAEQVVEQQILRGRVVRRDTGAAVESGEVLLLEEPAAFVSIPVFGDTGWNGSAGAEPEPVARAALGPGGAFELVGEKLSGYLAVLHPALAVRKVVPARATDGGQSVTLLVEPAGGISGTVVDASGAPLEELRVTLKRLVNPMKIVRRATRLRPAVASTDGQGRFRFWSVPVDQPMLLKAAPDDAPPTSLTLSVEAGQLRDVRLEIPEGHGIRGRVISDQGTPVALAKVEARHSALSIGAARSGDVDDHRSRGKTDEQGRFELLGLAPSAYTLRVEAKGFAPGLREDVELVAGGVELASEIVLTRGLVIRGVVVDDQGHAVPEATIGFLKSSSFMGIGIGALVPPGQVHELGGSVGHADQHGSFQSPQLLPGVYDVSAQADGLSIGSLKDVPAGSSGNELVLKRSGSIEGIVLSRAAGEPVSDYTIAAARPFALLDLKSHLPGPVRQVSKVDGTFRIEGLEAGTWNLTVAAEQFAREEIEDVEVRQGEVTRGVIVLLDPPAVIRGLVIDRSSGAPVAGADVTTRSGLDLIRAGGLAAQADAQTDEEGRFELSGLKTGRYKVSVNAAEFAPAASKRIHVSQGLATEGVTIYLDPGAVIHGRVIAASKQPEVGVLVQAVALGNMLPIMETTDAGGHYELRGLAAGNYTVTKIGGNLKIGSADMISSLVDGLATKTVKLKAGEELELDFIAGEGGSVALHGRVTEGGDPLEGAILALTPVDLGGVSGGGDLRMTTSGEHGVYRIENVVPGQWTMTIQTGSPLGLSSKESYDITVPALSEYQRDFDLSLTGFRGQVTTLALSKPLANIRVAVTALDESVAVDAFSRAAGSKRVADVFTDQEGFYRVQGLKLGAYEVVAGGPGMFGIGGSGYSRSKAVTVSVQEGELKSEVNFRLRPGGSLTGQVTDSRGKVVQAATVFLVGSNAEIERHFGEIVADETGVYRATGIEPGGYTVVVKATGYAPSVHPGVSIRESAETERDIVLRTGGTLSVVVTGVDAATLAGAKVRLFDGAGTELTAFVTLGEAMGSVLGGGAVTGRYELGALEPGLYGAEIVMGGVAKAVEVEHGSGDQVVEVEWP